MKNSLFRINLALLILLILAIVFPCSLFAAGPSLLFSPDSINTTLDRDISVDIVVDTAGQEIGGVGVEVIYEKDKLIVTDIKVGTIFSDYPLAAIDNDNGKVSVSGITDSLRNLYKGRDVFATITFTATSLGTSRVDFVFTPGDTTDSNIAVTHGNGDALTNVNSLEVVVGGSDTSRVGYGEISREEDSEDETTDGLDRFINSIVETVSKIPFLNNLFNKMGITLSQENPADEAPSFLENGSKTKTNPSQSQPVETNQFATEKSPQEKGLYGVFIAVFVALVVIVFVIYKLYKKKNEPKIVDNIDL